MTLLDRIIGACIEPACHAEAFARRVGLWVAEKAIDRHVCRLSRRLSEDDEEWDS